MYSSSRRPLGGRHELGQNFIVDRRVVARIVALVPPGPVVELGAGDGAVTRHLAVRGGDVTAAELDPGRVAGLRRTLGRRVRVVQADMLRFRLDAARAVGGDGAMNVVSNVPFGITTPVLRHLLGQRTWTSAVLLLQWEVARKRAAVGGTTLLTASWWPWYEFTLAGRVPSAAFRPRPDVDGGILLIHRRPVPLVPSEQRADYQRVVREAFRSGRPPVPRRRLESHGLRGNPRPRDLKASHWASLYAALTGARHHRRTARG
jgi:23S rRNA (adenine-N6)-dimethyltransferase